MAGLDSLGALAGATPQGAALSAISGLAAGGPSSAQSGGDNGISFSTGAKNVQFGPPQNKAFQNPLVIGGVILAVVVVAAVWMKTR